MVLVLTSHEIMGHGLVWAGYDRFRQENVKESTNIGRFKSKYGSTPLVCAQIWEDLQTTEIPEAHVDEMYLDLKYFLAANNWLFRYPTDEEQSGSFGKSARDEEALAHDRKIYPERTHNDRGERLWHNSPARLLLREDLAAGKYEKGKPQKLRESREEYQEFDKRIHQEIQTEKWHNSKWRGGYGQQEGERER